MFFNCTLQAVEKLLKLYIISMKSEQVYAGVCLLVTFIHVQANAGMKAHAMKFCLL